MQDHLEWCLPSSYASIFHDQLTVSAWKEAVLSNNSAWSNTEKILDSVTRFMTVPVVACVFILAPRKNLVVRKQ